MTKIDILAGRKSIGGNFIKVIDRDRVLVFDQGIRFDTFRRYFGQSVSPSGIMELRNFRIIPAEDWYDNSNDIYITHLHLDHLGALSNIPQDIQLHLPGLSIYQKLKEKWENSPTWLNLIPENYYLKVYNVQAMVEDDNRVLSLPVSHSAYPSVAYLYFGSDKTILYTGDIRVKGFLEDSKFKKLHGNALTLAGYLESEHDLKIDVLLLEGTNFGSDRTPVHPVSASETMKKILVSTDLAFITCHYLDYEFILAAVSLAKALEFEIYLTSEVVANALKEINSQLDVKMLEEFSRTPHFDTEKLDETLNEKSLYIISYNDILDILRSLDKEIFSKKNIACILTEPEPDKEEMMEYDLLGRWLNLYNIHPYRLRVSGHYYPFELQEILEKIKFREFIPIHTAYPEIMRQHLNHYIKRQKS